MAWSATRVAVALVGVIVAMAGFEHGVGEVLQGNVAPGGIMIESWPGSAFFGIVDGEPAMTLVPNLLASGLLTMAVSLAFAVWCVRFAARPRGWVGILVLAILLLLVGGGFGPPLLAVCVCLAATRIGSPPTWWRAHLSADARRRLAGTWPYLIGGCLAAWLMVFPGLSMLGYFAGVGSDSVVAIVCIAAFALLPPLFLSGFARDARTRVVAAGDDRHD